MALTLSPSPWFTGFDDVGDIVPGGKLFTYAAGTSTKKNTYTDVLGLFANTNPIILDDAGRVPSGLFLLPSSYKFILAPADDTDPPANPIRTQDNIGSVPSSSSNQDVEGRFGESVSAGAAVFMSDGSNGLIVGRWYLTDSDFPYKSTTAVVRGIAPSAVASGELGTIRLGGQVDVSFLLTNGQKYYLTGTPGAYSVTPPALNVAQIGVANSISSILVTSATNAGESQPDILFIDCMT